MRIENICTNAWDDIDTVSIEDVLRLALHTFLLSLGKAIEPADTLFKAPI